MAENKSQDYFDDSNEGHVDTRSSNFECDSPDKHLGCDLGIDVQGQGYRRCVMIGTTIVFLSLAYFVNNCWNTAAASCKL